MIPAPAQEEQFQIVTTTHKDVSERLPHINPSMFGMVRDVLEKNKSERHIRGGLATKEKYRKVKENKM